ncbi:MAG: carbon-nitrogen hydrolase family protein, partial [Bdellovibrionales bacterium]|nr:carbon-nitrogen hydrolase family protein [Bdellovibrionales bacterium]
MRSFGHSLVVDPWGEVLADGGEGEKLITAELEYWRVESSRKAIPLD